MKVEKVIGFKETLTSSIPNVEEIEVKQTKDHGRLAKVPCKCGETKNVKYVQGTHSLLPLCRECRKVTVLDITVRSLITQADDLSIQISPDKVMTTFDELRDYILQEHPIVRVSTQSSALKNKITKSKAVDLYQKLGLKLTKSEPTLTLI